MSTLPGGDAPSTDAPPDGGQTPGSGQGPAGGATPGGSDAARRGRPAAGPTDLTVAVRPGLRLSVRRWDGEALPAFVLVHGLASNARLWDGVAARLHAAGHTVVALDQRGHGRSEVPDDGYDFATVTEDLRRVCAALDVRRPVLVGQSWGGNVVLDAAARWGADLAGVAAVDGGTIDLQHRFPQWEEAADQLAPPAFNGVTLDAIEQMMRRRHADWPDEGIAGALANFVTRDDGSVRARLPRDQHMQILRALWEHRPPEHYADITTPVLLVPADTGDASWTDDKRRDVDVALRALPAARAQWLAGDHDLHAQQPGALAALLLDAAADGFFH